MAFISLKKISAFLRKIDIFGRKTELTMQKQSTYTTNLGGFFSLIMVGLSLMLFFNFGSDMLYHENPTAIFSKNPEKTSFSQENYFFMFGVEAPSYAHFIDESIYTINLINKKLTKSGKDSFLTNIPLERCTENHLPKDPEMHDYFMKAPGAPLNDLFCVKDYEKYFIEGSFDTEIYAYMQITVNTCVNKTNDISAPICKSQDEIKEGVGFFAFYTMDYLIDPQNFEKPGQPIGKDYYTPISVGLTRNTNRYIATTKVISDDGFLLSSKNSQSYPTYNADKETLLLDSKNEGLLMDFYLRKFHNNLIYDRSYKKIADVLAEIGGFIHILYLIFLVLSYPFISKRYFEKIINSIYNFEFDGIEPKKLETKTLTITPINPLSQNKSLVVKSKKDFQKKDNSQVSFAVNKIKIGGGNGKFMKSLIKIKNKLPLKTTLWEFIKGSLSFHSSKTEDGKDESKVNKYKRLNTGKKSIMEKLDISYILNKFYEIDKLKMLLFNDNQYQIFDYLPKPVILKNSKIDLGGSKDSAFSSNETDLIKKSRIMQTAYKNITCQNELSTMDKKLIDLLDDSVKEFLEVY